MAGQLWVWGANAYGNIGDNTLTSKSSPIQTISFGTDWKEISNGSRHIAAIKNDGTLWTWGRNTYGQLGDNTILHRSSPVQVMGFYNLWKSVACGYNHTLAIKTDGTIWGWGRNDYGMLGDNTTINKSSPVQTISIGNNWSQVAGGAEHTAAIKTDGTLWVWGRNNSGQLGTNNILDTSSPIQTIVMGYNWEKVSCHYGVTGAIKTDGTLWMCGENWIGQLGDNTNIYRSSPVQTVAFGNNWSDIDLGYAFAGAIKTDGTLWMWGANWDGQLGINNTSSTSSPIQTISFGNNWSKIGLGDSNSKATKNDGTLWAWGSNSNGNLGDNTIINKSSPVQTIMLGNRWSLISNKILTTAAIYENDANQLGINTQPLAGYNSNQLLVQPKININDSAGAVVRIANNSVTVAVQSGTATLSGTTTVTAVDGIATFTDLVLTGSGNVTLRFTSSGLTQVDSSSFTVSLTLPIIPKRSEVSDRIPTSGQLNIGELAINIEDKKGYVKKSDGTILNIFNGEIADGGTF